ncbi:MAG: polysaccharide biosynthesis protein [Bacilli bacterium]
MKKNSFIGGAFIATFGILIVKIIGVLYVVPFYAIIGEASGALYGYAYNIYALFLGISSAGIPFAISKITSEYKALGLEEAKQRVYIISRNVILGLSIFIFLILFFASESIAKFIIGSTIDATTLSNVSYVVKMISFAILIVPFISTIKGYLQGHKFITPTAISQIIEQIVRVLVILIGSYLAIYVFKIGEVKAVGIAVFGAFIGGVATYLYLKYVMIKNKKQLINPTLTKDNITNKEIIKKILAYAFPFVLVALANNFYNFIDMVIIIRVMTEYLGYALEYVENIVSIYTTWGMKLNMIVTAIATGLVTSLIPNIVSSFTKKDYKDVNNKFNKTIQIMLLLIVPITLFLSVLALPVWTLFYGVSELGYLVFRFSIFTALFGSFYMIITGMLQGMNKFKLVYITIFGGTILNAVLDIPLIILFDKFTKHPYYGAILATLIGLGISIWYALYNLKKTENFDYKETLKKTPSFIMGYILFLIPLYILQLFIPINLTNRWLQIPIIFVYGIVSFGIYIWYHYKNKNIENVFGKELLNKINIFKKRG